MVNKRKMHHQYKTLQKIKPVYLVMIATVFLVLGVWGMRLNYSHMLRLEQAVAVADKRNGDVETALNNLRQFVYNHMNTDLSASNTSIKPPIQLKYRYARLAKVEAQKANKINAAVKQKGEQVCRQKYPAGIFNSSRVTCVAEYVSKHSARSNPVPDDLYKFDFISPRWSLDLAGISLLLCLVFALLFIGRLAAGAWYKSRLS